MHEASVFMLCLCCVCMQCKALTGCTHTEVKSFEPILKSSLPYKILLMTADEAKVVSQSAHMVAELGLYSVCGGFFVEFLAPNTNKGSGFLKLVKHLDIDARECVAFGDGNNDIEMLQHAGLGNNLYSPS